ncbi:MULTISPECIES: bifunctional enoyl-CoA hydratase/phosphate acetyltransferase [unclassified Petrotoga]|uniref:bifunctional enoyl-CoA hydratase/phosphate acetyltransferase n=1 Tax=unclassified Petrotoga TaxID=2620614 RepID=UPI000EF2298E|nr:MULTISPECIES: bifunctional enoyl-CoA hydratase/phosphate acetyltransferase [unclassified Petrotoga]MBL5982112.1 phosphate butyryltransferase [Petrotoga sp. 8T1HF07.NaAc.6.1]RLL82754.1 phosphate butyryltransferase [Petrotoga sp. Shatin.DS.tank11.9.2.9.3]
MKNFDELLNRAKSKPTKNVVLVCAEDLEALKALSKASEEGFANPVLVGNKEEIKKNLEIVGKEFDIIEAENPQEAAEKGVRLVSSGAADLLMKGKIKTSELLKAVLNNDWGLKTGNLLSHVAVVETPYLDRLLLISDGGMIIHPDLTQKVQIIYNAIEVAKNLEIKTPKVALLAAVEVVNPDMPETIDAAILTQMNKRGQIKGCIVDGPLALDNAISEQAAKIKNINSEVAGKADILIVPDIHSGNLLGKSAVYFSGGNVAGIVVGAKAPVVLVSRADNDQSKLAALALGVLNS